MTSTYVRGRKLTDILGNDELEHIGFREVKFTEGCRGKIRLSIVLNDHIKWRNHRVILANQVLHVNVKGEGYAIQTTNNKF